MSAAVLISRVLGLVREQVFAYFFGATSVADAYLVAFRIPNLFRDLFAEGALSAAFVAIYSRSQEDERDRLLVAVNRVLFWVLLLLTAAVFLGASIWSAFLAPGFLATPGKLELTTVLTRIFSPFLAFVSFAAVTMGILNSRGSFFIPSMGAAAFNFVSIVVGGIGAYLLRDQGVEAQVIAFSAATLLGAFFQWMIQWPKALSMGVNPLRGLKRAFSISALRAACQEVLFKRLIKIMAPSVLSVAAVQINVVVNTMFAAALVAGSVAHLSYAFRLMHFPMGVFGVALSTAALPKLSRLMSTGDTESFRTTLGQGLKYTIMLAVFSMLGFSLLGRDLVQILFERGQFTREDTIATASVLAAYSFGLVAFNGVKILTQAFYALEKVKIASLVALGSIFTNYALNSYLAPKLGAVGLALSTSLVASFSFLILYFYLRKINLVVRLRTLGVFLLSLVPGCLVALFLLPRVFAYTDLAIGGTLLTEVIALCVKSGMLAFAFFGPCLLLQPDARALFSRLLGKFNRKSSS